MAESIHLDFQNQLHSLLETEGCQWMLLNGRHLTYVVFICCAPFSWVVAVCVGLWYFENRRVPRVPPSMLVEQRETQHLPGFPSAERVRGDLWADIRGPPCLGCAGPTALQVVPTYLARTTGQGGFQLHWRCRGDNASRQACVTTQLAKVDTVIRVR